MAKPNAPLLGPLELEVMAVVWERGDVAVADVVEQLRPARRLHHNTVMTVMKRLAAKDLLEQYARDGRTHGYRPRVTREEVSRHYLDLVRKQFFGGSLRRTIAAFVGTERMGAATLTRLRKLLAEIP